MFTFHRCLIHMMAVLVVHRVLNHQLIYTRINSSARNGDQKKEILTYRGSISPPYVKDNSQPAKISSCEIHYQMFHFSDSNHVDTNQWIVILIPNRLTLTPTCRHLPFGILFSGTLVTVVIVVFWCYTQIQKITDPDS